MRWLPRFLRTPFLLSFLLSSCITLLVLVITFTTQPIIPLFYSLAEPEQQLAAREWLLLFPVLTFAITFLHMAVVHWFKDFTQLMLKMFAWTTVGIQVVLAIALIRIVIIIS